MEKSFKERIRALYERDPKFNRKKAAEELGCNKKTLYKH